jgi:hypothetical protein
MISPDTAASSSTKAEKSIAVIARVPDRPRRSEERAHGQLIRRRFGFYAAEREKPALRHLGRAPSTGRRGREFQFQDESAARDCFA